MKKSKILAISLGTVALSGLAITTPVILSSCSSDIQNFEYTTVELEHFVLDVQSWINGQTSFQDVQKFLKYPVHKERIAVAAAKALSLGNSKVEKENIESVTFTANITERNGTCKITLKGCTVNSIEGNKENPIKNLQILKGGSELIVSNIIYY